MPFSLPSTGTKEGFFQEKFLTHDLFLQPPSLELEDFVNKPSQVVKGSLSVSKIVFSELCSKGARQLRGEHGNLQPASLQPIFVHPIPPPLLQPNIQLSPPQVKKHLRLKTDLGFIQTFQPPSTELHDSPNLLIQVRIG